MLYRKVILGKWLLHTQYPFNFTLLLFNHSQLCAQCSCNLVEHVNVHGILASFHSADIGGGELF